MLQNFDTSLMELIGKKAVRKALLIRQVELKLLELFSQGKLFGTVHTCIGQELTGVAIAQFLAPDDWIFSNHRCHGHFIAKTDLVEGLIAEIMGKQTGVCGGWGGSQHLHAKRFFSNGIQGGIVPVAAGLALAERYRQTDNIAVVFIGEGTLGEGVVYETANIAAKWNIPLLIVLENNYYSQSTNQSQTIAGNTDHRFEAFGIRCFKGDVWDVTTLFPTTQEAIEYTRREQSPAFLRIETYRLKAHSKGDDERDPREVEAYWQKDIINQFCNDHPDDANKILTEVNARVESAVQEGLEADYTQQDSSLTADPSAEIAWMPVDFASRERIGREIGQCLKRGLETDERVILLGEDIQAPYGGAFKVTGSLSEQFPDRVLNTPISEGAIIGISNGLALNGMLPICEIMFGDFMTLTFDQIVNHASKFQVMYNNQVRVPLVIRTPMGGGRGYGPTHSQSIEKHFLGLPQTKMIALNHHIHPARVYETLLSSVDCATIVIENKLIYAKRLSKRIADGFILEQTDEMFPTIRIRPQGLPELTIACYGGVLPIVEEAVIRAFDEHEIIAEVICPSALYPLNPHPLMESARRTKRLLVVEEGIGFAAWGSELIAVLMEKSPGAVSSIKRCAAPPHPIPSCGPLEKDILPNPDTVLASIREVCHYG